jgi:hypothetical protein
LVLSDLTYRLTKSGAIKRAFRGKDGNLNKRRRASISVALATCSFVLLFGSVAALVSAPDKTDIEIDFEHENVMLNIRTLGATDEILTSLLVDPVLFHGHPEFLPPLPSGDQAQGAAERQVAIEAARNEAAAKALRRSAGASLIGDSVSLGAAQSMSESIDRIYIDAAKSRTMKQAYDIVMELQAHNELAEMVIVSCGNNMHRDTLDYIDRIIKELIPGHRLVFVTVTGGDYTAETTAYLRTLPETFGFVTIADWAKAVEGNEDLLAVDGIHLRTPEAKELFASCVSSAVAKSKEGPAK